MMEQSAKDIPPEVLAKREFKTATEVSGPLLFVDLKGKAGVSYGEIAKIALPTGEIRSGQILEVSRDLAVIQLFEGTSGMDVEDTKVQFLGETMKLPVSINLLGRIFSGRGEPLDGQPPLIAEEERPISGSPINPYARQYPREFIQTGLSAIDGLFTLIRGQKLPIFSASGLPHNEVAAQIARQAAVLGEEEEFAVVFAAMGITAEEAQYFRNEFEKSGALDRVVLFLNLADDPAIERILTPKLALTAAEYLAFDCGMNLLVILTDMTNYAESLREIGAAREEVPGRRGYPGYLYSDLASIYERAGRIKGRKGTITQMPILSMPNDDMTHPVPDLSGYITEGQVILDRGLHRRGIYPPISVGPSLSRLMKEGIGKGLTRRDHKELADQLYYAYAQGIDLRNLVAVVGEESLTEEDHRFLQFADEFENRFINQEKDENRMIFETLDIGWELLEMFPNPKRELKRISDEVLDFFHPKNRKEKVDYNNKDV
ncbi:MAG: V-type ATP synthase subunit B [Asgard group archaeon]|nr:V-type ATP synthase subunit B [Asgard group archaeon]